MEEREGNTKRNGKRKLEQGEIRLEMEEREREKQREIERKNRT